ncbi:MAG TPA: ribonuclease J [Candidatus Binataceae bacterium]|nr:ribonuclease J [Candidatus Binataceae bacterium]
MASLTQTDSCVRLVALGGLGEIGLNLMVVESGGEALIIDAGVTFPEQRLLGADLLVPDLTYLAQTKPLAVVLTHGHDDHVGALPYLLQHYRVPVYGSDLALAVARQRLLERGAAGTWDLRQLQAGQRIAIGPFTVEAIRVTHSTPDALALAIDTPVGLIVHTGDFKIDETPVDGQVTDLQRLGELGAQGVTLMLSDSTNAERPGRTPSESTIKPVLRELMATAHGKVLLSAFSSHLHRFRQFIEVCQEQGRAVALLGRRVGESARLGMALGHLKVPRGVLIEERELLAHAARPVGLLASGSQAEPLSAMVKIATGIHPRVRLNREDVVILSSRFIPGNERLIHRLIDNLFRQGAEVFYEGVAPVHVSGHAGADELTQMIDTVRPRYFVPVHGEYRHLKRHIALAAGAGIKPENCFLLQNGEPLELRSGSVRRAAKIPVGRLFSDGSSLEPEELLRERERLAFAGVVTAAVVLEEGSGELLLGPELLARGFLADDQATLHLRRATEKVRQALADRLPRRRGVNETKDAINRALRSYFAQEVGHQPVVMPWVVEL